MIWTPNRRMALIAVIIVALDQLTKLLVLNLLGPTEESVIIDGFFKFVCWANTGAAWSLYNGNNIFLAFVSFFALLGLIFLRRHFEVKTVLGQISLGLIYGGIAGNLIDRVFRHHVIDFLRFYLYRRSGEEIGFPAFNVADSAICIGVGLMIYISWMLEASKQRQSAQ